MSQMLRVARADHERQRPSHLGQTETPSRNTWLMSQARASEHGLVCETDADDERAAKKSEPGKRPVDKGGREGPGRSPAVLHGNDVA